MKHRTDIKGHLGHLHIASIDPEGTHILLFCHPPPIHDILKVEVKLEPALKSPWELKPTLERWEVLAKKHFEIVGYLPTKFKGAVDLQADSRW